MTIINPFLLAGKDQLEAYQKRRINDWEERKGESQIDFDNYMEQIMEQWSIHEMDDTIVKRDAFQGIGDFDANQSLAIQNRLKEANILNKHGYINLKNMDMSNIKHFLRDLNFLSDEQISEILTTLSQIQKNEPANFETFSKTMFTTSMGQTQISATQSANIWNQLNGMGVIDDFGVLLLPTDSNELTTAVNQLNGINNQQKNHIIGLLNQHPELSYHSYIENFSKINGDDQLPTAGVYLPGEAPVKRFVGLSPEELAYIRIIAVLEWNVMLISQKSIHKSRKKSAAKLKAEKKQTERENLEFNEKIAAKNREEFKKSLKQNKKK